MRLGSLFVAKGGRKIRRSEWRILAGPMLYVSGAPMGTLSPSSRFQAKIIPSTAFSNFDA